MADPLNATPDVDYGQEYGCSCFGVAINFLSSRPGNIAQDRMLYKRMRQLVAPSPGRCQNVVQSAIGPTLGRLITGTRSEAGYRPSLLP
eukprot:gene28031-31131_t